MVLIHSFKENTDVDFICDLLQKKSISFTRINTEDKIEDVNIYYEKNKLIAELLINGQLIKSSDFKFFWYKGGMFNWSKFEPNKTSELNEDIEYYLSNELENIDLILHNIFDNIGGVGSIFKTALNKMLLLQSAIKSGLKIPRTRITSISSHINQCKNENVLVKYIQDAHPVKHDGKMYYPGLRRVKDVKISKKSVFPICLQELIVKDYEVRVFYFYGKTYAIKIEITEDIYEVNLKQTPLSIIESAKYNISNNLNSKLKTFLESHKLHSASLDFLVKDNNYYLIDINPIGEFAPLSDIGDFKLDEIFVKKIEEAINLN